MIFLYKPTPRMEKKNYLMEMRGHKSAHTHPYFKYTNQLFGEEQTNEEDCILFSIPFLEKLLDAMKSYLIALLLSKRLMLQAAKVILKNSSIFFYVS